MEKLERSRMNAIKSVRVADHLLTQTYPLVKDPKLLLAVLDNLLIALEESMSLVLYSDRLQKKIPPFHDNFESKLYVFHHKSAGKNGLNEFVQFIYEVKKLMDLHKTSAVEFTRKDVLVMATEGYQIQTVSVEKLREIVEKTKEFVKKTGKIADVNIMLAMQKVVHHE